MVHWLYVNEQPSYLDQKLPFDARSGLNVCAFISQQSLLKSLTVILECFHFFISKLLILKQNKRPSTFSISEFAHMIANSSL